MGEYSDGWKSGETAGRAYTMRRIRQIIEARSYHFAKTHYEGIDCVVCRILSDIEDEDFLESNHIGDISSIGEEQ